MKRAPAIVVILLGVLCMAPTAGDVGGCGAEVTALDDATFAKARSELDCRRCAECNVPTTRCKNACDPSKPPATQIPKSCQALKHDGEVCLRRLESVSCEVFGSYVSDLAPATPSECQFCKLEEATSSGAPSFTPDAAVPDGSK